jgi:hypothetical protein
MAPKLHGQTPAATYVQLVVFNDPAGGDYSLVRDTGDGINNEYVPVHIKITASKALRVKDAAGELSFYVDTSAHETMLRLVRSAVASEVPAGLVEGQIAANIEDGKLFLKGAGSTVHEFTSAVHTHTLSQITQSGAAANKPLVWTGSVWAPTTIVEYDLTAQAEKLILTGSLEASGQVRSGDPMMIINNAGEAADINGAGLTIQYMDGVNPVNTVQLVFDPTTYLDSGWALYHAKTGVEVAKEILTAESVIDGGTY